MEEWEASALLPENVAKTTKQVIVRPGTLKRLHSVQFSLNVLYFDSHYVDYYINLSLLQGQYWAGMAAP